MAIAERKNPFNLRYSVFFINRNRVIATFSSVMQDAQALLFVKVKGKLL
jgi:hypothetical protein